MILPEGYRLIKALETGGPKESWEAIEEGSGRRVVLKRLRGIRQSPLGPCTNRSFVEDPGSAAELLSNVPGILPFRCFADDAGSIWIEEPCFDTSVSQMVRSIGRLKTPQILDYGQAAALALNHAHRAGFVHADLKLENLGLIEERLFVADFALSILLSTEERHRVIPGTVRTRAPELCAKDGRPSEASDIWALGCVLFCMHTGHYPFFSVFDSFHKPAGKETKEDFEQEKMLQIRASKDRIDELLKHELSPLVEEVISCCLRYSPQDRYPAFRLVENFEHCRRTYQKSRAIMDNHRLLCRELKDHDGTAFRESSPELGTVFMTLESRSARARFILDLYPAGFHPLSVEDLRLFDFFDFHFEHAEGGSLTTIMKVRLSAYGRALLEESAGQQGFSRLLPP